MAQSIHQTYYTTLYHTNHSLRATAATCLYQIEVGEQIVMEHTGHHNLEGVWTYKWTSKQHF